jgi:NAD+ synthase
MTEHLTLTLAQLNPIVGDIDGNADKIRKIWSEATSDIVIFPELFICGYPPEDLILKPFFLRTIDAAVEKLVQDSVNYSAALLLSVPYQEHFKTYSAILLIHNGFVIHKQFKHELPNYGVFDEQRIFSPGPLPDPFEFKGHKIGFMICEDGWHPTVAGNLKDKGAEVLILPNGSPYSTRNVSDRMDIARSRVEQTGLPLVYVNQVGGQDEIVFDGTSFILNAQGKMVYCAPSFSESVDTVTLTRDLPEVESVHPGRDQAMYEAITLGLHDYVTKNGFPGVVIGLSGGIDSALTAAFCVDALGADKVRCVMLPSPFTSKESLDDAKACAEMLGCSYEIIDIEAAMKAFEKIIPDLKDVAHENMQSRTRGLILMALSNISGSLVISTGNKSEMAVGYATLYGDMNGGFNPIKDLYKKNVYALAKWRNSQSPAIPENILTKAPTAELRENQTDQDSLPPYDVLDDILECLIEWEMGVERLKQRGHDEATVMKIWTLLDRAEYKRRQACPGVKITGKAFGRDRRYPITNKFFENIEKA